MTDTRNARTFVETAFTDAANMRAVQPHSVVIWGGKFDAQYASKFIQTWITTLGELPYRMYEYVGRFEVWDARLTPPALPDPIGQLERARFFGPAGDLDLRRDGEKCYWRFIGEPDRTWPALAPDYAVHDFWKEGDTTYLYAIDLRYHQWRKVDERVNADWLTKAGLKGEDEYLLQRQYWQNGRVQFVRYIGFASKEG